MWHVWGREVMNSGFWWGNLRKGGHLEDPGIGRRIILKWIFEKWDVGGMDWNDLAQDRDRWRAVVNAVMNIRVSLTVHVMPHSRNFLILSRMPLTQIYCN
jgi:hypothetical protein